MPNPPPPTHPTATIDPVTRNIERRPQCNLHRSNSTLPTRYAPGGGGGVGFGGGGNFQPQVNRRLNNFYLDEQSLAGTGPLTQFNQQQSTSPHIQQQQHPQSHHHHHHLGNHHHQHQHNNPNGFNISDNSLFMEDMRSYI